MTTNWDSFRGAQRSIVMWANAAFPARRSEKVFIKLMGEMAELAAVPDSALEFADLMILLLDYAYLENIDIAAALEAKMEINRQRRWNYNPATGLAQHIEEDKNDRS